jgi:cytoskeleton protein RodZ
MRGVTLEEIASATKIGTRNLKALEDEEFKKLPGGIFNKGFVRAYSKFLGIDEEQAVHDFLMASGESEAGASNVDATQLLAQHEESRKSPAKKAKELESIQDDSSGFPWFAIAGLILILAIAYGARLGYVTYRAHRQAQIQEQEQAQAKARAEADAARAAAQRAAIEETIRQAAGTQQQPASAQQQQPGNAQVQPVSTQQPSSATQQQSGAKQSPALNTEKSSAQPKSSKAQPAVPDAVTPGNFVISIRAREDAWVSVTADGKEVLSRQLPANAERTIQAHDRIILKTGNAGGMDVALNGQPMPSLGAKGEVRTVTIGPGGILQ